MEAKVNLWSTTGLRFIRKDGIRFRLCIRIVWQNYIGIRWRFATSPRYCCTRSVDIATYCNSVVPSWISICILVLWNYFRENLKRNLMQIVVIRNAIKSFKYDSTIYLPTIFRCYRISWWLIRNKNDLFFKLICIICICKGITNRDSVATPTPM